MKLKICFLFVIIVFLFFLIIIWQIKLIKNFNSSRVEKILVCENKKESRKEVFLKNKLNKLINLNKKIEVLRRSISEQVIDLNYLIHAELDSLSSFNQNSDFKNRLKNLKDDFQNRSR